MGWQDGDKYFTAGDYQAVGLDGVGISQAQVKALQAQLQGTQAKLQSQNVAGLTKHDLTGALMQTSVENYFMQTWAKAEIMARNSGMVTYRLPTFGSISTTSLVTLNFGIPTRITPSGVTTDMDRIAWISVQKANDSKAWIAFNQALGSADSRIESGVLEQQYSTPSQPLKGVTAVQALATAAQQGQRIYTINASNAGTAMAQLHLSDTAMQDIANGVNAGLTVTTGQSSINYAGQTTSGYIILDPATGAAAYKIASGADGGKLALQAAGWALTFLIFGLAVTGAGALLILLLTILNIVIAASLFFMDLDCYGTQGEMEISLFAGLALLSLIPGGASAAQGGTYEGGSLRTLVINIIMSLVGDSPNSVCHAN